MRFFLLPPVASNDSVADACNLTDFIVNIARYTSWPGDVASEGLTVQLVPALPEDRWTHRVGSSEFNLAL